MTSTNKPIAKLGLIALALGVATFGLVVGVFPAHATNTNAIIMENVSATVPMSLHAVVDAATSECANAPGPPFPFLPQVERADRRLYLAGAHPAGPWPDR